MHFYLLFLWLIKELSEHVFIPSPHTHLQHETDLKIQRNKILDVCVSPSLLFSASTDKTVCVWDSETGERVKRLKGHTSFVNSCFPARRGPQLACTGSDDGTVKVNKADIRIGWRLCLTCEKEIGLWSEGRENQDSFTI